MAFLMIQAGYIVLTLLCLTAIGYALQLALKKTEPDKKTRRGIFRRFITGLLMWIFLVSAVSLSGFLQHFDALPPRLFIFLLFPLIMLVILLKQSRTGELLKAIPPQWLIYIQLFRVPVEILLWRQFALGLTPIQMTFEGLNFDILAGISAPIVGLIVAGRHPRTAKLGLLWNVLCLGLLLNIVTIAILSFPSPLQLFMNEPANTLITYFPFAFLPLVLVPIAYFMHALSIKQLLLIRKDEKANKLALS